jgi:hypothetical protein
MMKARTALLSSSNETRGRIRIFTGRNSDGGTGCHDPGIRGVAAQA